MHSFFVSFILFVVGSIANPVLPRTLPTSPGGQPIATVRNGSYYGTYSATYNRDFFLGIPFAQPPLEQLRFANPQSLNWTWTGSLPATNYAYASRLSSGWISTNSSRNVLAMEAIKLATNR
jgi:acetylcholinesterase